MRVSQRLDYTLRMLVALARTPDGASVAAGDLASRIGLPRRFGEQQMTALARAGLVSARRGMGGGVALARPPAEISLLDVVRAVQGDALDVPRVTGTAAAEVWAEAAAALEDYFASTTLAQVARRQAQLDAAAGPAYFI